MERDVRPHHAVDVGISDLPANGEVLRGVCRQQVELKASRVNGLVEARDADDVEAVVERTNADRCLRRRFLHRGQRALHQHEDHAGKHDRDGEEQHGGNHRADRFLVPNNGPSHGFHGGVKSLEHTDRKGGRYRGFAGRQINQSGRSHSMARLMPPMGPRIRRMTSVNTSPRMNA